MRDICRQPDRVPPGLLRHTCQGDSLRLGFQDSGGFPIYEQQVIGDTGLQGELAHSHPAPDVQVRIGAVLHHPSTGGEQGINILSGTRFGSRHQSPCFVELL